MKRSYFLKMLDKVIDAHVEQFGDKLTPQNRENLLHRLDIAIDDLGMLPPTTTLNKLGVTDNAWEEE